MTFTIGGGPSPKLKEPMVPFAKDHLAKVWAAKFAMNFTNGISFQIIGITNQKNYLREQREL